mgnify:CR=1 FL=1
MEQHLEEWIGKPCPLCTGKDEKHDMSPIFLDGEVVDFYCTFKNETVEMHLTHFNGTNYPKVAEQYVKRNIPAKVIRESTEEQLKKQCNKFSWLLNKWLDNCFVGYHMARHYIGKEIDRLRNGITEDSDFDFLGHKGK